MKKLMIILMLLKISKESKREYAYDENKNLNTNENDSNSVLFKKGCNNDTFDEISQIMHPHAKLGKCAFPYEFFIVNKDNDLPVLSEDEVNSCLNEVENTIDSAVIFDANLINSCQISKPKNELNENIQDDGYMVLTKSSSIDETCHLNVYNNDNENKTKCQTNNMRNKPDFVAQNNKQQCFKRHFVCEKTPMLDLNLFKTVFDKNVTNSNLQFYSSIQNHTKRIKDIEKVHSIFDKHKHNDKIYKPCFGAEDDKKLLESIFKFFREFDKSLPFNQDSCLKFLAEFDFKLFYSLHSIELRVMLAVLPNEQTKIVFYSELMRLYRYAVDIPELLTLGGLYFHESSRKVILTMHLINLFAENIDNLKENKNFIMFLIYKTFNSYYGRNYKMFRIPYYELELCNFKHDLTFFTWELNPKTRQNIKKRFKDSKYTYNDKKCLKIVLLLFLYQHTIFIKYFNIDAENVSIFQDFIEKVIQSESCVGCLFDEYLSILQQSIKKYENAKICMKN